MRKVCVIGLGNEQRGDDGVGRHVVRALQAVEWPEVNAVTLAEESGEGLALMDRWKGYRLVLLVVAVHSGAAPGTIHRLDAQAKALPSRLFHFSTHTFGVVEAVELARAMNQLPPVLMVYAIEGRQFESGESLSGEVARAAQEVAGLVGNVVLRYLGQPSGGN